MSDWQRELLNPQWRKQFGAEECPQAFSSLIVFIWNQRGSDFWKKQEIGKVCGRCFKKGRCMKKC